MIDPERVEAVFIDCLFQDGEDQNGAVIVDGIMNKFGFNSVKLEFHRAEINGMLDQLPDDFKQSGGGGMSFLNACNDRAGEQWTGLHLRMDQLFSLGQAIDRVELCLPRELWNALPGGMPYYMVKEVADAR